MQTLITKALELGAVKWEKGSICRVYINTDQLFGNVFGLEQISERSSYAGKFQTIGKAKVWFDVNKSTLHSDVGSVRVLLNQNGFKCGK